MDSLQERISQLFTSMGALKKYNKAGGIVGDTTWSYPLVSGFPHEERNTAVYRCKQAGHILDTAALTLLHWVTTNRKNEPPRLGQLGSFMAAVSDSDILLTSEISIRFITDEARKGSKCVAIIAMYPKLAQLSSTNKGPVAYFMSSDKYCVCIGVGIDSAWKGVKYLLEEEEVCKVFLDAAKDLPNLVLVSEALQPCNLFCLKTQHKRLEKLGNLPAFSGQLPQFHLLYGVQNVVIEASGDRRMSNTRVLRYCYETKSVLRCWQSFLDWEHGDHKDVFAEGYRWKLYPMINAFTDGHASIMPLKAILTATRYVQEGHDLVISLLASAHIILTCDQKHHFGRIKDIYDEIFNLLSIMTANSPISAGSGNLHQTFIHETANMLVLKILPCENYEVGSLGDVVRRMRLVMPNFMRLKGFL